MKVSVVIPSYRRGQVAIDSVNALLKLADPPDEILLVDQTSDHPESVEFRLGDMDARGQIRWIRLPKPSIPGAMNIGLCEARHDIVLFLDDDIIPGNELIAGHRSAQREADLVAGMVLQPGEAPCRVEQGQDFRFNSDSPRQIAEFMGGNFSVKRALAISLGGFDQNFVGAAYRFEAEFAFRFMSRFGPIHYDPRPVIHHLQIATGGTRAHGHHLRTSRPTHSVGAYYYLLRTRQPGWWRQMLWRPLRAVRTRHHLRRPWWIPPTLLAEFRGLLWAIRLNSAAPALIPAQAGPERAQG